MPARLFKGSNEWQNCWYLSFSLYKDNSFSELDKQISYKLNLTADWDKDYPEFVKDKLAEFCDSQNFDKFFEKENFVKIEGIENARKHDIIVFKYLENHPSHFGIYLGQNHILHQPRNKKSIIEKLTDAEKRRIYCFVRSNQIC